ncbi:GNAT family N-acetyltransferase [Dongia sp.]|uniref:GNAT family N-acetyltransferase n=1 Tax=Dongia sp. TaxID=1977262 RepID=UPI0037538904
MSQQGGLSICAVEAEDLSWRELLACSPWACLFHEPSFLAYHPQGRFHWHHLIAIHEGQPIALIPGGVAAKDGRKLFRSPLGASFGGPVLAPHLGAEDVLALLSALTSYAKAEGWAGIELTPPPAIYRADASDTLGFALQASGFALASRMLCSALPLNSKAPRYQTLYRTRNATKTRAAQRAGIETVIGGRDLMDEFTVVLNATYQRHGVAPTHTLDELNDLIARMPERFSIALARHEGLPVAGLFLMKMNERVENAFYICRTTEDARLNASLALFALVIDRLGDADVAMLDLGPSSMPDGSLNHGVCFFKEGIGAIGYSRDRWAWSAA